MANRTRGRVVVVTGASAGVGRATAIAFAKKGAKLAILARGAEGLEDTLAELRALGADAIAIPTDVSDAAQVERAADLVHETYGAIDVWVNNAMVSVFAPFSEMTPAEYRRVTEVTYLGHVWGARAALKYMRPANKGTIVHVGSALAYRGIPLQSAYCGAKHAIVGFVDSLRTELFHDKSRVHVGMVHLPAINTPQFNWVRSKLPHRAQPVAPIYQPEVPARAIVWMSEHRRRSMWVGGSTIEAIVGNRLVPVFIDHFLARTGFKAQQTEELERPRADNLWSPVPHLHATHGRFDRRARAGSLELWASMNKSALFGGAAAGLALGALAYASFRNAA